MTDSGFFVPPNKADKCVFSSCCVVPVSLIVCLPCLSICLSVCLSAHTTYLSVRIRQPLLLPLPFIDHSHKMM